MSTKNIKEKRIIKNEKRKQKKESYDLK